MPKSPAKPCRVPSCPHKVKGRSYCPDHEKEYQRSTKFRNKKGGTHPNYNKKIWRGNPNKPFGKRGGLREKQLLRNPLCECDECQKRPVPKEATVVDHCKDWKEGSSEAERWFLFTSIDNLQSMAESCHNAKTARTNK